MITRSSNQTQYPLILRLFVWVRSAWVDDRLCLLLLRGLLILCLVGGLSGCQHLQVAPSPMPVFAPSQVIDRGNAILFAKNIEAKNTLDGATQLNEDHDKYRKFERALNFDDNFYILENWF